MFERLFRGEHAGESDTEATRRAHMRNSVLDSVRSDRLAPEARLGTSDNHSLANVGLVLAGRFGNIKQGALRAMNAESHARVLHTVVSELGLESPLEGRVNTLDLTV